MASLGPNEDLRDRSIGELMRQLADETKTLVQQELALARAEMTAKAKRSGPGFGMMGAAAAVALLALGALTAFFILVLDTFMPAWLAALIVTLVYAAIAGGLYLYGKQRVKEAGPPVPEQTVETLKEDAEWAKTRIGSG